MQDHRGFTSRRFAYPPFDNHCPGMRARGQRGFTLAELLMAMAIAAILLAVAAPSFSQFLASQRLVGASNRLLVEIQTARMLAVHRNSRVGLCGSIDGERCTGSTDWSSGTLTFVDINHNGQRDPSEPATRRVDGTELDGLRVTTSSGRVVLAFNPDGFTAGSNLTLRICARERPEWRQIIVNLAGRSRVNRPAGPVDCAS